MKEMSHAITPITPRRNNNFLLNVLIKFKILSITTGVI